MPLESLEEFSNKKITFGRGRKRALSSQVTSRSREVNCIRWIYYIKKFNEKGGNKETEEQGSEDQIDMIDTGYCQRDIGQVGRVNWLVQCRGNIQVRNPV